jgi:hypothetical protein
MTRVGDDLVEALTEMAAYLRGDVAAEAYIFPPDGSTVNAVSTEPRVIENESAVVRRIPRRK